MAITGILKTTNDGKDYGVDFDGVYYKIDDLFVDTLIEEVRVGVRGRIFQILNFFQDWEILFTELEFVSHNNIGIIPESSAHIR